MRRACWRVRSTAIPGRTLADWSTQVLALADHHDQSRFDVIGVSCGGAYALARIHPWLPSPMFLLDRAALAADPELGRRFVASMAESYRQGVTAAMHEARLIARPRPYRLEDIRVPVHVFQGGFDRHVPEAMGEYLAQTIPGAQWHLFPDEGHLSIVWNRFEDCLAVLS
jgi:pimeloyl-ACP methyl ester carboxylesterase